jgi:AAA family ATP:ADP antiporter
MQVKPEERSLALSLLIILSINALVYELSDVVATSGFVTKATPDRVPWLWAIDAVVIVIAAVGYATVVDRAPRSQIVAWIFGIFAVLYLTIQMFFYVSATEWEWLSYLLLYILNDQQLIIFPLAFWSLANDVYTVSESKRLFPIIGAGYTVGSIMGNVLAWASTPILEQRGRSSTELLTLNAILLLIGAGVMWLTFRHREVRARQAHDDATHVRETVQVGADFFANVSSFRFLGLAIFLGGIALVIIEYHFLFTFDRATAGDPLEFQRYYSLYNIAFIVTTLLTQWLIAGRILGKVSLKNAFVVFPTTLTAIATTGLVVIASSGLAAISFITGVGGRFLMRLIERVWEEPSRKAVENLIPDERRGRISAFLDSYFYALATLTSCMILIVLVTLRGIGWLTESGTIMVYLGIAAAAAIGGITATLWMRSVYDKDLLNWRLARSRRKSALDGIEF